MDDIVKKITDLAAHAQERYGDFQSTHEAYGVACEEFHELLDALRLNSLVRMKHECIDLAAVLVRLAEHCDRKPEPFASRSTK